MEGFSVVGTINYGSCVEKEPSKIPGLDDIAETLGIDGNLFIWILISLGGLIFFVIILKVLGSRSSGF